MSALLAAIAAAALAASGPSKSAAKADMTKAPAVGPVKAYKAPPRTEWRLPNGIQAFVVSDRRFPLVTLRFAARGGDAAVSAKDAGHASALAALLTEGAAGRTAKQIADAADALGGGVSASSEPDYVVVDAYALSDRLEDMLGLASDVALRPDFPEAEVDLRKRNMRTELEAERAEAGFLAKLSFFKQVFAGHPYAVTQPTEASIDRLSRDGLQKLHKRLFSPAASVVVLIGDVDVSKAVVAVGKAFGGWTGAAPGPDAPRSDPGPGAARRVYLVPRPGSPQAVLQVGHRSIPEDHPDFYPLLLANQVLGGSFAARLSMDLREKRGYTYGVYSRLVRPVQGGAFSIGMQVRNEVIGEAAKALFEHLELIRREAPSEGEMAQAKNYLAGSFTRKLETQEGLADQVLHGILHRLAPDAIDRYVEHVQAVTAQQAWEAAKKYIRPDSAVIVAVGEPAKTAEALKSLSSKSVQTLDVNGDP